MHLQHSALLGRIRWLHIVVLATLALAGELMATPASAAASGTWTLTGSMNALRVDDTATVLPDGEVLATSGFGIGAENGGPFAELYTPATGQWSPAVNGLPSLYDCSGVLACFGSSATLLGDGNVLVAGGDAGLASNSHSSSEAVLYNPTANSWTTTGSLNVSRLFQTASLLQNGQVLVAGGESFAKHAPTGLVSAELYTP
jgi:hypothetical protein